ncbi:MAG: hypothetical protein ACLTSZ_08900 [Lachnospiraceae bacterium]
MISSWQKTLDMQVLMQAMQSRTCALRRRKRTLKLNVKQYGPYTLDTIFGSEITQNGIRIRWKMIHYVVKCNGSGGQSFGALFQKDLTPEAGRRQQRLLRKGTFRRNADRRISAEGCEIQTMMKISSSANVALYGATSGKAFINGVRRRTVLRS